MELLTFLPLFIIMGAFLWFASRRQRKAMQATIDLHDSLQVGDRVYTTSGLAGDITEITEDTVSLQIAPGVVTEWMKLAIREKIVPADVFEADDVAEITESSAEPFGAFRRRREAAGQRLIAGVAPYPFGGAGRRPGGIRDAGT